MNTPDTVIIDYLNSFETDYAIMISGEWGCGKSYYISHVLNDIIEGTLVPNARDNKDRYYSSAYISLYGVSSAEDFEVRVFNGINPWLDNRFWRITGLLASKTASFFGISLGKSDAKPVTNITRDKVLIFDDLERICEDKIPVKEVLGLINLYAEHLHSKVIIVCNEEKYLFNDEDVHEEHVEDKVKQDYKKYKEKSVRFTYKFEPNVYVVYDKMVSDISEEHYKSFLIRNKTSILSLFELGGKKNLRTLKFFIDTFEKVFRTANKTQYKDSVIRSYLVSFMLYVCEYKSGVSRKDLISLDLSQFKIDTSAFLGINPRGEDKESEKEDYLTIFKERYDSVYSEFKPSHLLIDYIATGYLDEESLWKETITLDSEYDRLALKDEGKVFQKLQRMTELRDEEIIPLINEMIGYVKEDRYNLYDLLSVYALLLKYDYWRVNGFELTDELDNDFKAAIERRRERHIYNSMFELKTPMWDSSEKNKRQYEKYNAIKSLAMKINLDAKNKNDKAEGVLFIAVAESGDVAKLREYRTDDKNRIAVSGMDWDKVAGLIINAPNPVACEICDCLIFFIPNAGFINQVETERVKEELIPALNNYMDSGANQIRKIYINELRNHLVEVLY